MDIFSILFGRKSGGGSGGSVTVDPALSGTSENPVQNKAIKAALDLKAAKTQLPTKLTDLTNDAGFMTGSDVAEEIADAIGEVTSFEYYLCGSGEYDAQGVPTVQNPDASHIYLTPTDGDNLYMYAYIGGSFVFLGTTEMDLDGYVTETDLETELGAYATLAALQAVSSAMPTKVSDLTNDAGYVTDQTLAPVALSGAYWDLNGKPNLATVATSGSYNDLSNKPTIPVVPGNLVTGSASAYTINVSSSAPAAGTANNVITIVV